LLRFFRKKTPKKPLKSTILARKKKKFFVFFNEIFGGHFSRFSRIFRNFPEFPEFPGNFLGVFRGKITLILRSFRNATATKSKKPSKFFDKKTEKLEKKMFIKTLIRPHGDPVYSSIFDQFFCEFFQKKNAKKP